MNTYTGIYQLSDRAVGRVRRIEKALMLKPNDPLVPDRLIAKFGLRTGLDVEVIVGQQRGPETSGKKKKKKKTKTQRELASAPRVEAIKSINGMPADEYQAPPSLEDQISIDPQPRLKLEYPGCPPVCRLVDLFCPIGYGQRGMIVSPPKAGKTILLQQIASALSQNYPDLIVQALLIDERPEEVTDFRRNVPCEVIASSNDHPPEQHVMMASVAIERCKRMVEQGKQVAVLLDSLTRLGRAFNTAPGLANSGKTLSGGMDSQALSIPKQLFGSARNIENGGSLTIIATCLVDTGSRADQLIFEEFKGTGNMELILDRELANQRIYPAINLAASGTRKEHLLLDEKTLQTATALRRRLLNMSPMQQIEQLLKAVQHFPTNDDMVGKTQPAAAGAS